MFFSKIVAVFAVAVAAVTAGARPLPLPLQKAAVSQRGEQAVRNMEEVVGAVTIIGKRQGNVNTVPADIPTQSKDGVIVPFQGGDVTKRQTDVQDAVMSDGGDIVPFKNGKRQVDVQDAAMSDGGDIVPFKNNGKRDVAPEAEIEKRGPRINTFPTWIAARSDGGEIVAF